MNNSDIISPVKNFSTTLYTDEELDQLSDVFEAEGLDGNEFFSLMSLLDEFIYNISGEVDAGVHTIQTPFGQDADCVFIKHEDDSVYFSSTVYSSRAYLAVKILLYGSVPVMLHSADVDKKDGTPIRNYQQGWTISVDEITPLRAQQVIDICCTDFETGGFKSPEPNTEYLEGMAFIELYEDEDGNLVEELEEDEDELYEDELDEDEFDEDELEDTQE